MRQCLKSGGHWYTDLNTTLGHQTLMSALFGVGARVAGLESAMNAYGEITGINGLGRGVDEIARGHVGSGGLELAMALPLG